MKKLKNLKARLLSLSLAFAMVLSLAMGMAPMNVQAEGGETVTVTLDSSGFTGNLLVAVILDKEGEKYGENILLGNGKNVTATFPVGGQILVMSNNINFTVTVTEGTATVSEPQVGEEECGYIVNGIVANCTLSIGSTSVGHFLRTVHTCYPFLFSAPAFALV